MGTIRGLFVHFFTSCAVRDAGLCLMLSFSRIETHLVRPHSIVLHSRFIALPSRPCRQANSESLLAVFGP